MKLVQQIFGELLGLFVDDGSLALQLALLIAFVAIAVKLLGLAPLWGAAILLLGSLAILSFSLRRMLSR